MKKKHIDHFLDGCKIQNSQQNTCQSNFATHFKKSYTMIKLASSQKCKDVSTYANH